MVAACEFKSSRDQDHLVVEKGLWMGSSGVSGLCLIITIITKVMHSRHYS